MLVTSAPLGQIDSLSSRSFELIPLGPLGAKVECFFNGKMTEDKIKAIRDALLKHKMLLFRDHTMTPEEQIEFTKIFGRDLHTAGPRLRHLQEHPEIFRIANQNNHGNVNTGQYWHADGHYLSEPSPISAMHIVSATADGATLVTDTARAYRRLSQATQAYLAGLSFLNLETGRAHSMVRKHPVSGEINLFVNLHAVAVDTLLRPVPEVIPFLENLLSQQGTFYSHNWLPGDTIIVDNFATAHCGTASDPKNLRVMHRTSVMGQSVWWRQ